MWKALRSEPLDILLRCRDLLVQVGQLFTREVVTKGTVLVVSLYVALADRAHRAIANLNALSATTCAVDIGGFEVVVVNLRPLYGGLLSQFIVISSMRFKRRTRRTLKPTTSNNLNRGHNNLLTGLKQGANGRASSLLEQRAKPWTMRILQGVSK